MAEAQKNKKYINKEQCNWILTQSYTRLMHRQYEDCLTLLRGLQILHPENPDVYCMMSYAYLETNNPEECLLMVDRYLEYAAPDKKNLKEIQWIQSRAQLRLEKNNKPSSAAE